MTYMQKDEERVLVAERARVFDAVAPFQGYTTDPDVLRNIIRNYERHHAYKRRGDMEQDPSHKQLIPYVMIRRGDELFAYHRLAGGGEERLHGMTSVGFGGHMNEVEGPQGGGGGDRPDFKGQLLENLWRELYEELHLDGDIRTRCRVEFIGVVNDDETESGKCHLGLVAVLELPSDRDVIIRETDAHEGRFMGLDELGGDLERLESWSRFLVGRMLRERAAQEDVIRNMNPNPR